MIDTARDVLVVSQWAVLAYFLAVNTFYLVLLVSAAVDLRRHLATAWRQGRERLLSSPAVPRLSVLVPAYNEESGVAEAVRAMLTLRYPDLEVVLVNDGSTDRTLEVLTREFELTRVHGIFKRQVDSRPVHGIYRSRTSPGLVVVDKENGAGKADALNAALNVASGELVCAIDADTIIEPDALLRMVQPFLHRDDVIAAGGTVRVVNGSRVRGGRVAEPHAPRRLLAGVQAVEYLRAFLFGRLGWNRLGGNLVISGAFGLFRREAMIAGGGYEHDTVGEDMEVIARLRRRAVETGGPSRVAFVPDPVAWTEVPEDLRTLAGQRDRWHRGLADVLWRHRRVLLNPRYRALGLVVFPYFAFVELLAPVIEALGLAGLAVGLGLGAVSWSFAALFFLAAYGYGLVLTAFTMVIEELGYRRFDTVRDRMLLLLPWTLIEGVGYRQLTVVWRLRGLVGFLRRRQGWGEMVRRGFEPVEES